MDEVDKRRMCPSCRAFVSAGDSTCQYCDAPLGERIIDIRNPDPILGFIPAESFATAMIFFVNIAMYIACVSLSLKRNPSGLFTFDALTLIQLGGKLDFLILYRDEWWRLLTAGFLHGNLTHIVMNLFGLYSLGPWVEEQLGSVRVGIIYVLTSIAGFALSLWWSPSLAVGASAAVFGLLGAMVGWGFRNRKSARGRMTKEMFWRMALYSLVLGLMIPNTDNAAHVGGLVAGIVLGYVLDSPKLRSNWQEKAVGVLGMGCLALTVWSLSIIVRRLLGA
jgi:rhomboid protease GluP